MAPNQGRIEAMEKDNENPLFIIRTSKGRADGAWQSRLSKTEQPEEDRAHRPRSYQYQRRRRNRLG